LGDRFSRTIQDQELLLDEHGFGHDRTDAPGTGEPGDGRQQMENEDSEMAHPES